VLREAGGNPGPAWNATSFAGAILTLDELESAPDQRGHRH
jgi:hypothetical protein